jgi:hypothetical protein
MYKYCSFVSLDISEGSDLERLLRDKDKVDKEVFKAEIRAGMDPTRSLSSRYKVSRFVRADNSDGMVFERLF